MIKSHQLREVCLGEAFIFLMLSMLAIPTALASGHVSFSFVKIADQNTPIPEGSGTFEELSVPAISNGNIVFRSIVGNNNQGIYLYSGGGISKVADKDTLVPGGEPGEHLVRYGIPSISGQNMAFFGQYPLTPIQNGIYVSSGGNLTTVVDQDTVIPGSTETFYIPSTVAYAYDSGSTVFVGDTYPTGAHRGIYIRDANGLYVVAGLGTGVPGGSGNFTALASPGIDGANIVFHGQDVTGLIGIYARINDNIISIVDTSTPRPDGGSFSAVGHPDIDGDDAVFFGRGSSGINGIYTVIGGILETVADKNSTVTAGFTSFNNPSIDNGNVVFLGGGPTGWGIFTNWGGALVRVIDTNDTLEGKVIRGFNLKGGGGISGNLITFQVQFSDDSYAIYSAVASLNAVADGDLAPWDNPDGQINAADALIANQLVIGLRIPGPLQYAHGDMDQNGVINLADLLQIQQAVLH